MPGGTKVYNQMEMQGQWRPQNLEADIKTEVDEVKELTSEWRICTEINKHL